jgi:hypothetical protein
MFDGNIARDTQAREGNNSAVYEIMKNFKTDV